MQDNLMSRCRLYGDEHNPVTRNRVGHKAYQELPRNHPDRPLPFEATDDDDRSGWNPRVITLE